MRAQFFSGRIAIGVGIAALTLSALTGAAEASHHGGGHDNTPPHVVVKVGKPNAKTGAVRIGVTVHDTDYKRIRIRVPAKTSKGTITPVLRRDGSSSGTFTYTPTTQARHSAASDQASSADTTDTFTVTVTDGYGGTTSTPVSVPVAPQNSPPVAGAPIVGQPDGTTGVVTGQVQATDPDGDPLSYQVVTLPTMGSVVVGASGQFTYTPTSAARHTRGPAESTTDTFTITITDGYGGSTSVPVSVPL